MRRLDQIVKPVGVPRDEGFLDRGLHRIHWTDTGNIKGIPVIYSHGGPGAGQGPHYRKMFDLEKYRVIQMSQRGAGLSTPKSELRENDWSYTLGDMEALREHLGIDKWLVAGGSWGSTISILYGEHYPENCLGILLICMWLARPEDVDFWFQGATHIFPECYDDLIADLTPEEQKDIPTSLGKRVFGKDKEISKKAAQKYGEYHYALMTFEALIDELDFSNAEDVAPIFFHYLTNQFFVKPNQLLRDSYKLKNIPIKVVQGRYDICTTVKIAYDFKKALPHVDLRVIDGAGHILMERGLLHGVINASNDFYELLK